jgi:hypothetical protein
MELDLGFYCMMALVCHCPCRLKVQNFGVLYIAGLLLGDAGCYGITLASTVSLESSSTASLDGVYKSIARVTSFWRIFSGLLKKTISAVST